MEQNVQGVSRDTIYKRRYRERNKRFEQTLVETLDRFGSMLGKIGIELVRASNSNPLIGIMTTLTAADILLRLKIIDHFTFTAIVVSVGAIEGSQVAGTIINDVSDLFKFFGSQNKSPDPISPSASTIVYGGSNDEDLQALMEKMTAAPGKKG